MLKTILPAIAAIALAAAPAGAATGPTSALSLSSSARAGEALGEGNALSGMPLGTWISVAFSLLGAYLAIDALSDDDSPVSA